MTLMAHHYPTVVWHELSYKQLTGYLCRVGELYQREMTQIEIMQERETKIYRMENNI